MALFATLDLKNTPVTDRGVIIGKLASAFQSTIRSNPKKKWEILVYGIVNQGAPETESRSMESYLVQISLTLQQKGVPNGSIFLGDLSKTDSNGGGKVELYLEEVYARYQESLMKFRKPPPTAELSVNKNRELTLEITVYKIATGKRTYMNELSFKKNVSISPVAISNELGAELIAWKPKIDSTLKKIGVTADKVEFAIKITSGAKLTVDFSKALSYEINALVQGALKINATVPKIGKKLPIEISYSFGGGFSDGKLGGKHEWMIKVILFEF